ncbi:MAG: mannose-6-phosphate isomerase, class I [Microbacterium pygmaeum]
MLVALSNVPRDYDWGSATLLPELQGRAPSGAPEAEVWFGDHPGSPAMTPDGRSLNVWLEDEAAGFGIPPRLPYLLKLLAAGSSLSIQSHPSRAEAAAGFAREEAAGIDRDAADRTYRDENHKPELIVAVSDTFTALAGLRDLAATRRLLGTLGAAGAAVAARLPREDEDPVAQGDAMRGTIAWLLSGDAGAEINAIVAAVEAAESDEFAAELALLRTLGKAYPGDPGVVIALLMNLIVLTRGEGLFVPAGVLHAYQAGLGVEIMAASDNVLRGGLTPKHINVGELVRLLDPAPGLPPVLRPSPQDGAAAFDVDVPDFALTHAIVPAGRPVSVAVGGPAIVLGTAGAVTVRGAESGESITLEPGEAVFVTPDERAVRLDGHGEAFVAQPGAEA